VGPGDARFWQTREHLKLRIVTGGPNDIYKFQNKRSKHETDNIQIAVDKNRAGTGPWTGLAVPGAIMSIAN
jgi:hypothetical protein